MMKRKKGSIRQNVGRLCGNAMSEIGGRRADASYHILGSKTRKATIAMPERRCRWAGAQRLEAHPQSEEIIRRSLLEKIFRK